MALRAGATPSQEAPWLEALLHPLGEAEFFDRHFEREALYLRRLAGRPAPDLSGDELERLMAGDPGLAKRVEAVHAGKSVEIIKSDPQDSASAADVNKALESGATVRLIAIQEALPGVQVWADRLSEAFGGQAGANAYLTPAETPGVAAHYDTHDVLVYQVRGSKHWSVFVPASPEDQAPFLPMPSETARPLDTSRLAKRSMTLEAGDILYIPRGAAHATVGGGEGSVHLTFGVQPQRWRDVMLEELLANAEDDPFFRRAARPGQRAEFERRRSELVARLLRQKGAIHDARV